MARRIPRMLLMRYYRKEGEKHVCRLCGEVVSKQWRSGHLRTRHRKEYERLLKEMAGLYSSSIDEK